MNDSYKVYASQEYVDNKVPEAQGAHKQLVTDADGNVKWEDRAGGYSVGPIESVLMEEQTISFTYDTDATMSAPSNWPETRLEIVAGNTYHVYIDGATYTCNATAFYSYVLIGNAAVLGMDDTGEPFLWMDNGAQQMLYMFSDTSDAEHIIRISEIKIVDITIPGKYLPIASDDSYGSVKLTDIVTTYVFSSDYPNASQMQEAVSKLNEGRATIVWQGERYVDGFLDDDLNIYLKRLDEVTCYRKYPLRLEEGTQEYYSLNMFERAEETSDIFLKTKGTPGISARFCIGSDNIPIIVRSDDNQTIWTPSTKVSELENDAGYITSYTETDPTVPAWAKEPNKPTYAASEIGAGTLAGEVVASTSSQAPDTALLRNSKLVSTDTNPTVNGEIYWTYG